MVLQQLKPKSISSLFIEKIYYIILITVHFLFNVYRRVQDWKLIYWQDIKRNLSSCWKHKGVGDFQCDEQNYGRDLVEISRTESKLSKIPKHIAISVSIEEGNYFIGSNNIGGGVYKKDLLEVIDLQALAKLITWCWAANASVISLYDHHGQLKTMSKDLENLLQREFNRCNTENVSTSTTVTKSAITPTIKFHQNLRSKDSDSIYSNGVNGLKSSRNTLHIILLSVEDGREKIIQSAKDLFQENLENRNNVKITEDKLDCTINRFHKQLWSSELIENNCPMDPELLIILGNVQSTLGFSPWHIRLTEIQWIPTLKIVEPNDFTKALKSYSNCQQRFGT